MSALISPCKNYRYWLTRGKPGRRLCFVMLNPSTADATVDDPTIRRCLGYMNYWGFTELLVLNLYAYRATDPRELRRVPDPHGPDNRAHWVEKLPTADLVVCAWGSGAGVDTQGRFLQDCYSLGVPAFVLGLNKNGSPKHPLYQPRNLMPQIWHTMYK